jgi:hypothetical protein
MQAMTSAAEVGGGQGEIPLTGADCFLRAFDGEVRRTAGATHNSQLILRLGPGFDVERFRALLEGVFEANPIVHAPIRRAFGLAAPVYRTGAAQAANLPPVEVHERPGAPGEVPELFFERLNGKFVASKGQLARFDVVRYDGGRQGTDLAMSWLHMLFDGAGCEWFIRWLDRIDRGEARPDLLPSTESDPSPGLVHGLPGGVRGQRAMRWQNAMKQVTSRPVHSLAGPLSSLKQELRYDVEELDAAETSRVKQRASERVGFIAPMAYHLACAIRAHHAVFKARGLDPSSYVVPLPVDLRPKGPEKAIFRTRVSLIWFRVDPDLVEDFDGLLQEIKRQRRESIRKQRVEDGAIAMDFARYAPMRVYTQMARRSLRGELCSFFFAYTGCFAGDLRSFLGAPLTNAFTSPSVPPSPGSALTTSLFGDRMNLLHVHQKGVFSASERALLAERMRAELLGEV